MQQSVQSTSALDSLDAFKLVSKEKLLVAIRILWKIRQDRAHKSAQGGLGSGLILYLAGDRNSSSLRQLSR